MATWEQLLTQFTSLPLGEPRTAFLVGTIQSSLQSLATRRNSQVLIYASGFLQKPTAPPFQLMIVPEDINGFMATINGMDFSKPLTLVLHTPGGVMTATETIVEYLREKFTEIEVVVPVYAMSAGTMIALSANRILMGRQSQLGPIDSQFSTPQGQSMSASSILAQFESAKKDISIDKSTAAAWAPILASIGPSLLQQARNALDCGAEMVTRWLIANAFKGRPDADTSAKKVADYFNSETIHLDHGRRIDAGEVSALGLDVAMIESDQALQEDILTLYHAITLAFEQTPATKIMFSHNGRSWIKNVQAQVVQVQK